MRHCLDVMHPRLLHLAHEEGRPAVATMPSHVCANELFVFSIDHALLPPRLCAARRRFPVNVLHCAAVLHTKVFAHKNEAVAHGQWSPAHGWVYSVVNAGMWFKG